MGVEAVIELHVVGAALLALWTIVRFPELGPRRPTTAIGLLVGAGVAMSLAQLAVAAAAAALGPGAALVLVVLPTLTAVFWTAGCLFRVLLGALR